MNSNIKTLQRKGKNNLGLNSGIDDLKYQYSGNQLTSVKDDSGNYMGYPEASGNIIPYDENGNMTHHKDKGILEIKYNILNLPDYVVFDKTFVPRFPGLESEYNVNTQYLYRADGTKLRKIYTYGTGRSKAEVNTITEYLDGFQYEMEDTGGFITGMPLKFVPTVEGYYNFEKNQYIYSYTDHLGNIRVSYSKNASGSAEVLEENNFYPFGLKHEGYNAQIGNPSYNYEYNGKELQKETGWSDYGARMYMSDIGRWGVIDPLAEQMRRYSPYNYAYNNPISYIDPDGRKPMGPDDEIKTVMMPTTMLMFYANGGSTNNRALMQWVGQPDSMGDFFVAMDKLNSVNSKGGGGGSTTASDPTPKSKTGPGIINTIVNFFSNLFGGKKKEAKITEFGPLEKIPLEEKKDMTWALISAVLFGNADPYSAIGNAGVGPYAEERENIGMAAMIFISPEAASEGLLKNTVTKAGSRSLVNLTEETFSQALYNGIENVGGYSIYGTKGLVGNTFNRNVFLLEASGAKSLSGFRSLFGSMEAEAIGAGASKISIYGSSVINQGFLNPSIAQRFGYSFEKVGNGIILQKALK